MKNRAFNRRSFLSHTTLVATALATLPLWAANGSRTLRAGGYRFPRLEALFDGSVGIEGFETSFEEVGISTANTTTFQGDQTWDFLEIGLHPFMLAYANDGFREFTLLPIYPLRLFRHKSIFIRKDAGITGPEDLRGRKIGTPGYSTTSLTWIRGMINDEYGISPEDVEWVLSNQDSAAGVSGKASQQETFVPEGLNVSYGPPGMDESEMLTSGEVDALFHAVAPKAYLQGDPRVGRLFENSREVELDYYRRTNVFPIMHAVAVRRSLLEEHTGLARAIFNAYSQAKTKAYTYMNRLGWAADMLPWYGQEMEHTVREMGRNFYSYGMKNNRKSLETLFRYSHEQGLSSSLLTVEELFHPESLAFEE